jgi:hypothetical protein
MNRKQETDRKLATSLEYGIGGDQRLTALALIGIISLAAVARLCGIGYGLPDLFYHHDEPQIVLRALRFGTGDFNPHIFWWPGTFQMDLMFVVYAGMFVAERILGLVTSAQAFAASYFRNPSAFYLSGRLMTLAFSLATVWLMFVLGKRTHSWVVAAVGAFFLSVNPMHVEWSRLVLPVVPMVFWVMLSFLACLKVLESTSMRWYFLAGVSAGLAASCVYYGGVVIVCLPLAHWLRMHQQSPRMAGLFLSPQPYLGIAAMVLAFLAVCPYSLLDFQGFRQDIGSAYFGYAGHKTNDMSSVLDYLVRAFVALAKSLRRALGVPIAITSFLGLGLSLRRPTSRSILAAAFIITYLIVLGFFAGHRGRHMAPVVPFLTILAASVVVRMYALFARVAPRRVALLSLCVLLSLPSVLEVARTDCEFMRKDTRIVAREWIEATIPPGTRIVLDASAYRNTVSAPIEETDENIERRIADLRRGTARGYGFKPAYLKYYEMMLKFRAPSASQYDQWWTEFGTNLRPIEWFRENGYQYAMVSSIVTHRYYDEGFTERFVKSTPFYRQLDSLCVLVKTVEPEPWRRPGPTIKIYSLR